MIRVGLFEVFHRPHVGIQGSGAVVTFPFVARKLHKLSPMAGNQRKGRWIKWSLAALLLLELIYVASSAVILNSTFLKSQIDSDPKSLNIKWDFAISPLPLLAWVWGGSVRVQDSNIQMWFRLATASIWVDPKPLFHREFHALSPRVSRSFGRGRKDPVSIALETKAERNSFQDSGDPPRDPRSAQYYKTEAQT
jgi:hypothetical protein